MDFDAYVKQMFLRNSRNWIEQTKQYEQELLHPQRLPLYPPLQPPLPFLSSSNNNYNVSNYTGGAGLDVNEAIQNAIKRNAKIIAENREKLLNDEEYQAQIAQSEGAEDTTSQRQSLELYFNELQDGGFGGTDINRENTRKALFNLKNVGLSLTLQTIQRFTDITNEFLDSFILSVNNPQFSEILLKPSSAITPAKKVEILKNSLRNLDSIENILRILKILDVLDETYNFQALALAGCVFCPFTLCRS